MRAAISVINMKGGVGKTTIATLLCRRLAQSLKVLAIDLDPQANMSQALMGEDGYRRFLDDNSPSVVEVFKGYQPPSSAPSPTPLDATEVARAIRRSRNGELRIIPSRFDFSNNLRVASTADEQALARFIANGFHDIDIVIIDCAPTESVLTRAAYHASRHILVPVRPEYFATIGFPLLHRSLEDFRGSNPGHDIDVLGVVINDAFYDGGNQGGPERIRAMAEIEGEAAKHHWRIFDNQIPFSRGFPKMMRGDHSWLGNATMFYNFARELRHSLSEEGYLS
ncbi:ParA family protein [Candidatus Poriferisodalis sp.]|uniref:ParA family protein n=1 Tax=Candidatus Poriferisodalis sp. TaxID=3101277 RepID=UPI003B5C5A62